MSNFGRLGVIVDGANGTFRCGWCSGDHPGMRTGPIAEVASLALRTGRWAAAAHTRPAFYDPPSHVIPNVDNVLLTATMVAGETSVVMVVAHGNYKDNGCALASEAAVVAADGELAVPFLGEADVGPALQRAIHAADERIRRLEDVPLSAIPTRLLETCVGRRKTLRGVGASMIAAIVTPRQVFVAHAGECAALIVRASGEAKYLTRAHTLAMTPQGREAIAEDPSQRAWLEDIVLNVLGFGNVRMELTRAPIERGDRVVIGNPAIRKVRDFSGPPDEACVRIGAELTRANEYGPATLAIAALG